MFKQSMSKTKIIGQRGPWPRPLSPPSGEHIYRRRLPLPHRDRDHRDEFMFLFLKYLLHFSPSGCSHRVGRAQISGKASVLRFRPNNYTFQIIV